VHEKHEQMQRNRLPRRYQSCTTNITMSLYKCVRKLDLMMQHVQVSGRHTRKRKGIKVSFTRKDTYNGIVSMK
jgi:hypothetical protein